MPALKAQPSRGMCPRTFVYHGLSLVYQCHCHLQCFDAPPLFVACLNTSVLLPCCLCLVDGALSGSGDCPDVWNVWCSSAHYTIASRGGTGTLIRQSSLLPSFSVRSELIVSHNASALAQEAATRMPKWKDLGSLPLRPEERQELSTVS